MRSSTDPTHRTERSRIPVRTTGRGMAGRFGGAARASLPPGPCDRLLLGHESNRVRTLRNRYAGRWFRNREQSHDRLRATQLVALLAPYDNRPSDRLSARCPDLLSRDRPCAQDGRRDSPCHPDQNDGRGANAPPATTATPTESGTDTARSARAGPHRRCPAGREHDPRRGNWAVTTATYEDLEPRPGGTGEGIPKYCRLLSPRRHAHGGKGYRVSSRVCRRQRPAVRGSDDRAFLGQRETRRRCCAAREGRLRPLSGYNRGRSARQLVLPIPHQI